MVYRCASRARPYAHTRPCWFGESPQPTRNTGDITLMQGRGVLPSLACGICPPGGRDLEQPSSLCAEAERPYGRYCLRCTVNASRRHNPYSPSDSSSMNLRVTRLHLQLPLGRYVRITSDANVSVVYLKKNKNCLSKIPRTTPKIPKIPKKPSGKRVRSS